MDFNEHFTIVRLDHTTRATTPKRSRVENNGFRVACVSLKGARYPGPRRPCRLRYILNNVIVKSPLTPHRWHTQEQRLRLVVAKKPVSKKAEQVLRRRARGLVASLPHPAHISAHFEPLPIPAHLELPRIHRYISFNPRYTARLRI